MRELINVVERAVLLCRGTSVSISDLPPEIARGPVASGVAGGGHATFSEEWLDGPLDAARRRLTHAFEERYLRRLLTELRGRVGEVAHRAGITERTLYDLMKKHGLRKEDFKRSRSA